MTKLEIACAVVAYAIYCAFFILLLCTFPRRR